MGMRRERRFALLIKSTLKKLWMLTKHLGVCTPSPLEPPLFAAVIATSFRTNITTATTTSPSVNLWGRIIHVS